MQYQARKRARTLQKRDDSSEKRTVSPIRQQQKDNLFDESDVKLEDPVKDLKLFEQNSDSENRVDENNKLSEKRRSLSESEIHKTKSESDNDFGSQKKQDDNAIKQSSIEEESSEHYYPTAVDTQSVEGVVTNVSCILVIKECSHSKTNV